MRNMICLEIPRFAIKKNDCYQEMKALQNFNLFSVCFFLSESYIILKTYHCLL